MTNDELREACKQLLELRDHSCIIRSQYHYYFCCGEPDYKPHKPDCERVKFVDKIISFISQYLNLEGWPKERIKEYINLERADNPSYISGEEWNEAIRLCRLAALKERNKVGRKEIFQTLRKQDVYLPEHFDDLATALLELINGKEI